MIIPKMDASVGSKLCDQQMAITKLKNNHNHRIQESDALDSNRKTIVIKQKYCLVLIKIITKRSNITMCLNLYTKIYCFLALSLKYYLLLYHKIHKK